MIWTGRIAFPLDWYSYHFEGVDRSRSFKCLWNTSVVQLYKHTYPLKQPNSTVSAPRGTILKCFSSCYVYMGMGTIGHLKSHSDLLCPQPPPWEREGEWGGHPAKLYNHKDPLPRPSCSSTQSPAAATAACWVFQSQPPQPICSHERRVRGDWCWKVRIPAGENGRAPASAPPRYPPLLLVLPGWNMQLYAAPAIWMVLPGDATGMSPGWNDSFLKCFQEFGNVWKCFKLLQSALLVTHLVPLLVDIYSTGFEMPSC